MTIIILLLQVLCLMMVTCAIGGNVILLAAQRMKWIDMFIFTHSMAKLKVWV